MIMVRTLRRDIARYNTDDSIEDTLEETGWKLVHGDVFRPPKHPRLFSAVIGSGIQIFYMSLITICKVFIINFMYLCFKILIFYINSFSDVGNVVTVIARCSNDHSIVFLRVQWLNSWLFCCTFIQNNERT